MTAESVTARAKPSVIPMYGAFFFFARRVQSEKRSAAPDQDPLIVEAHWIIRKARSDAVRVMGEESMFTVPPFAWMIQPRRPAKQMVVMKMER